MVAPSLYLLVGKEEFLKAEFIQNLKTSVFKNSSETDLNFQKFDGESGGFIAFKDFLKTSPFLSEKRLAVLSGIDDLEDEEQDSLLAFIDSFPAASLGVLVSEEANAKKNPFLSTLSSKAKTVSCYAPFDRDLPQWIQTRAKQAGIRLETAATSLLIDKMGKDIAALSSSLETLAVYIYPKNEAKVRDVEMLLGRSLQNDIFSLMDVLLKKDAKASLSMAGHFLSEGTRGFEIVSVLAGQFERLRRASRLMEEGVPGAQIGSELRVHSFFLEKFLTQAKSLSRVELRKAFEALLLCDESIKTGALSERLAVERLVLSLCLQPKDL